jgi:glucan phosphoethanolaminetransferase (alkaline phosphatase superfamily)
MLKETDIKEKVFAKIRTGTVSMRPRIYFVVRIILLATVAVITLALAMLVLSFAFFSIHESGEQFLLGFGQRGFMAFIMLFPWLPLLLTLLLVLLLDFLLRYFKFGYRISVLEIFLLALAVVVGAGILINFTPLHATLLNDADHDTLPLIGPLYEELHDSHQAEGIYRGDVSSIQGNEFVITHNDNDQDTDDGTWTISAPAGFDMTTLRIGEPVYVAGRLILGVVQAYGVHELTPDRS